MQLNCSQQVFRRSSMSNQPTETRAISNRYDFFAALFICFCLAVDSTMIIKKKKKKVKNRNHWHANDSSVALIWYAENVLIIAIKCKRVQLECKTCTKCDYVIDANRNCRRNVWRDTRLANAHLSIGNFPFWNGRNVTVCQRFLGAQAAINSSDSKSVTAPKSNVATKNVSVNWVERPTASKNYSFVNNRRQRHRNKAIIWAWKWSVLISSVLLCKLFRIWASTAMCAIKSIHILTDCGLRNIGLHLVATD